MVPEQLLTLVMCLTTSSWISFSLICLRLYIHMRVPMLYQRSLSSFSEAKNRRMNKIMPPVLLCTTFANGLHKLGGMHSASDTNFVTLSFSMGPGE